MREKKICYLTYKVIITMRFYYFLTVLIILVGLFRLRGVLNRRGQETYTRDWPGAVEGFICLVTTTVFFLYETFPALKNQQFKDVVFCCDDVTFLISIYLVILVAFAGPLIRKSIKGRIILTVAWPAMAIMSIDVLLGVSRENQPEKFKLGLLITGILVLLALCSAIELINMWRNKSDDSDNQKNDETPRPSSLA